MDPGHHPVAATVTGSGRLGPLMEPLDDMGEIIKPLRQGAMESMLPAQGIFDCIHNPPDDRLHDPEGSEDGSIHILHVWLDER